MDGKQQLTSLRLVQLDQLVQVAVEQAYNDLQDLTTQLPKQTDAEK